MLLTLGSSPFESSFRLAIVMSGIPSAESLAHLDAWLVLSDAEDVLVRCWTRFAVPSDSMMFQVLCALACGFAGDDWRVGMATSRLAQMLVTAIGRLGSSRIRSWLDAQKIAAVDQEAEVLLPHLKAVACKSLILFRTRR